MDIPSSLVFSSNNWAYILVFVVLPLSILYGAEFFRPGVYNRGYLSKDVTGIVKGICIVVVILHHFSQMTAEPGYLYPFTRFGYLAVAVFFFLSGYSLMVSLLKNPSYLDNFIRRRLSRVYVPLLVINAFTLLLYHFIYGKSWSLAGIIMYITGLKLFDPVLWFVDAILLFYIVFYWAFRFFTARTGVYIVFLFSAVYFGVCHYTDFGKWWFNSRFGEWWYNTSFCFPLGIFAAYKYREFTAFMQKNHRLISVACLIIFPYTFYAANWYIYPGHVMLMSVISGIACVVSVIVFLMKVNLSNRFWTFAGVISYELYLVHLKVFCVYFDHVKITGGYSLYIFLILVFVGAWLFNRLFDYIRLPRLKSVAAEDGDSQPEPEAQQG